MCFDKEKTFKKILSKIFFVRVVLQISPLCSAKLLLKNYVKINAQRLPKKNCESLFAQIGLKLVVFEGR
jgi:hypothetical protein